MEEEQEQQQPCIFNKIPMHSKHDFQYILPITPDDIHQWIEELNDSFLKFKQTLSTINNTDPPNPDEEIQMKNYLDELREPIIKKLQLLTNSLFEYNSNYPSRVNEIQTAFLSPSLIKEMLNISVFAELDMRLTIAVVHLLTAIFIRPLPQFCNLIDHNNLITLSDMSISNGFCSPFLLQNKYDNYNIDQNFLQQSTQKLLSCIYRIPSIPIDIGSFQNFISYLYSLFNISNNYSSNELLYVIGTKWMPYLFLNKDYHLSALIFHYLLIAKRNHSIPKISQICINSVLPIISVAREIFDILVPHSYYSDGFLNENDIPCILSPEKESIITTPYSDPNAFIKYHFFFPPIIDKYQKVHYCKIESEYFNLHDPEFANTPKAKEIYEEYSKIFKAKKKNEIIIIDQKSIAVFWLLLFRFPTKFPLINYELIPNELDWYNINYGIKSFLEEIENASSPKYYEEYIKTFGFLNNSDSSDYDIRSVLKLINSVLPFHNHNFFVYLNNIIEPLLSPLPMDMPPDICDLVFDMFLEISQNEIFIPFLKSYLPSFFEHIFNFSMKLKNKFTIIVMQFSSFIDLNFIFDQFFAHGFAELIKEYLQTVTGENLLFLLISLCNLLSSFFSNDRQKLSEIQRMLTMEDIQEAISDLDINDQERCNEVIHNLKSFFQPI